MPSDLDAASVGPLPPGWRVEVVAETGSTNADLLARAADGAAEGLVLVAERQHAGRGRLDRAWSAPPGTGLTFSVLLRPAVPPARLGWLPLVAGLAVAEAVGEAAGVRARLKWPNDVVVGERKLAGVLVQVAPGGGAVVGIGLNTSLDAERLPVPTATSLALEGAHTTDRARVLAAVLGVLAGRHRAWAGADGDADGSGVRPAYLVRCTTIGRDVRVDLPRGGLEGQAVDVDGEGRLHLVDAQGRRHQVAAGDIVHLR